MRRHELEEKIEKAFKDERPALRESIIEACKSEAQLPRAPLPKKEKAPSFIERCLEVVSSSVGRRVAAFAVCLVMIVGAAIGFSAYFGNTADDGGAVPTGGVTTVYIDVNPSVVLELDSGDKIIKCTAANSDGEDVIASLKLSGKPLDEGIDDILAAMYEHEFITSESNSVLISIDGSEEKTELLLADAADRANHSLESRGVECSVIAQSVRVNDEIKREADERGVSPGKMHLINKMVGGMDDYTDDDKDEFSKMSIKELNLIYSSRGEGDDRFEGDVSAGSVGGYKDSSDGLEAVLADLGVLDIEGCEVRVKVGWERADGDRRMVYILTVKLADGLLVYTYKIDCKTGEILSREVGSFTEGEDGGKSPEGGKGHESEDFPEGERSPEGEKAPDGEITPEGEKGDEPDHGGEH